MVDATAVWLTGSLCLMLGALFVSLSRSGMTAGVAALLALVLMSRNQGDRSGRVWLITGLTLVVAVATAYTSYDALAARVEDTVALGLGGRQAIWRDTWVMIEDFWRTGIGAGAYVRGMLVYQTGTRQYFYFNHAHNEYLQILAEGGLLLSVPVAVAGLEAARGIARRLREDESAVYWIRAGAASGLVAILVESVWDTGVLMPANAVMVAILAAMALHDARSVRVSGAT
jgi:O-antigen ligase